MEVNYFADNNIFVFYFSEYEIQMNAIATKLIQSTGSTEEIKGFVTEGIKVEYEGCTGKRNTERSFQLVSKLINSSNIKSHDIFKNKLDKALPSDMPSETLVREEIKYKSKDTEIVNRQNLLFLLANVENEFRIKRKKIQDTFIFYDKNFLNTARSKCTFNLQAVKAIIDKHFKIEISVHEKDNTHLLDYILCTSSMGKPTLFITTDNFRVKPVKNFNSTCINFSKEIQTLTNLNVKIEKLEEFIPKISTQ